MKTMPSSSKRIPTTVISTAPSKENESRSPLLNYLNDNRSNASLLNPMKAPPACETPLNCFDIPRSVGSHRKSRNYLNEMQAQKSASQDDLSKQEQRKVSQRDSFDLMSSQIYKRKCSLTTDIPPTKPGYGYSGDESAIEPSSSDNILGPEIRNPEASSDEGPLLETLSSIRLSKHDDTDTGDESSVSGSYWNNIAGQKGGKRKSHHYELKERANQLRNRINALNQEYTFKSPKKTENIDSEIEGSADENSAPVIKDKRVESTPSRRRPSFNFNEYRSSMLRKSLSSGDAFKNKKQ